MRYFSILDGANLTNEDTGSSTKYYGYTRPGGSGIIMKYDSTAGTYTFSLYKTLTAYNTGWTNRASNTYAQAGEFKRL